VYIARYLNTVWERGLEQVVGAIIKVIGDVQGVGFRMIVKRWASEFRLGGYVRNIPDGSVEIYVEGPRYLIDRFTETLKLESPTQILDIEVKYTNPRGFKEFYIVP